MSLPVPLTVRLVTVRADRHVETDLENLSFRSVIPGGFASARMTLNRPLRFTPDEISYYSSAIVYDARNGAVVFEGRLEDPGRGTGGSGEVWDLNVLGPSAHAQDKAFGYVMIHTNVGDWRKAEYSGQDVRVATVSIAPEVGGDQTMGIWCSLPPNVAMIANARSAALYNGILEAGHELALLTYKWDAGLTSSNYHIVCETEDATIVRDQTADTAGSAASLRVVGTNWTIGQASPRLMIRWEGTPGLVNNNEDRHFAFFDDVLLAAVRYNADGTKKSSGYTVADALLYADQVVADLLGRHLDQYDGANAVLETDAFGMDQLAYDAGTTAAQIFDDLMMVEPTKYWAAWERNPLTDKFRFEWRAWPTTVSYEASTADGYTSTGSAEGLYNEVAVTWVQGNGLIRTTVRTQAVPELDDAGITRRGHIDLGNELNSQIMATRMGDQFLADHLTAPNQGQLTVARPIYDADRGMMVQPWELRPGKLIRVRDIQANPDALNATERDGVTVFKVIGVEFNAQAGAATLELDSEPLTLAHKLARIQHGPVKSTRRVPRRR